MCVISCSFACVCVVAVLCQVAPEMIARARNLLLVCLRVCFFVVVASLCVCLCGVFGYMYIGYAVCECVSMSVCLFLFVCGLACACVHTIVCVFASIFRWKHYMCALLAVRLPT